MLGSCKCKHTISIRYNRKTLRPSNFTYRFRFRRQHYNINADYVAAAIGSELKAEKLILLTDVEGIYRDIDDPSSLISVIKTDQIDSYIEDEVLVGGMLLKLTVA